MSTTLAVLPVSVRGPGAFTLPDTPIPVGIDGCTLGIDVSSHTDPAIRLELLADISFDAGASWIGNSLFTDCWIGCARNGSPGTRMEIGHNGPRGPAKLPQPTNPNRRIRGRVTIAGGAFLMSATLTLFP